MKTYEHTTVDWELIKSGVCERIDVIAATMGEKCDASAEVKEKLWIDLVKPNVLLLAQFCSNITCDDVEDAK